MAKKTKLPVKQEVLPVLESTVDTPLALLTRAIDKGVAMDIIERLIALQNEQEKKVAKREYLDAFSHFQNEVTDLVKNKTAKFDHRTGGGKTEYSFHALPDIIKHVKDPLSRNGLSYRWDQKEEGNKISVWCIITHRDGHEQVGGVLSAEADTSGSKNSIQAKISTISYLRRVTLMGILGLASGDVDDDGKGAVKSPEAPIVDVPLLTDQQLGATIKKVMAGEWTLEMVEAKCVITEAQRTAIKVAEDNFKKKTA